jgi:HlyD family secretion protein
MKRTATIVLGVIGLLAAGALAGWLYFRAHPGAWEAFLAEMKGQTAERPAPERTERQRVGDEELLASGTIEASAITVSSEIGGRVQTVAVQEGESVTAGQLLVQLDTAGIALQQTGAEAAVGQASAGVDAAEAQLALARAGARPEEITAAESAVDAAQAGVDAAEAQGRAAQGQVEAAEAQRDQAQGQLDAAQAALSAARAAAQAAGPGPGEAPSAIGEAEANVTIAQAALDAAEAMVRVADAHAEAAQAGIDAARAQLEGAQASLDLVRAGAQNEEIALLEANVAAARSALEGAQSALAGAELQQARLKLVAPIDGVILQRLIEPSELASPAAPLVVLADLDQVTLTVYVPQASLRQVSLRQSVEVTVDAYDEAFLGEVSHISSQAEFTPSNVQTQAERVNLVFAVEISLPNPDHALKPGMPADAVFQPPTGS